MVWSMYVCMHVCKCIFMYVCMYVCMYTNVYVCFVCVQFIGADASQRVTNVCEVRPPYLIHHRNIHILHWFYGQNHSSILPSGFLSYIPLVVAALLVLDLEKACCAPEKALRWQRNMLNCNECMLGVRNAILLNSRDISKAHIYLSDLVPHFLSLKSRVLFVLSGHHWFHLRTTFLKSCNSHFGDQ